MFTHRLTRLALGTALALAVSAEVAQAQIRVQKDRPDVASTTSYGDIEWTGPLGYRMRPSTSVVYCNEADRTEVGKVAIGQDLYREGMISPEQAKALALCAVPGQISSGEMSTANGRTHYDITLIPNDKKTHTKVQIDAQTGEVINAKQFGGLRGLAGFLRESAERSRNKENMERQRNP